MKPVIPLTLEPAAVACLDRARTLTVRFGLLGGITIAISGWLLRGRDPAASALHWGSIRLVCYALLLLFLLASPWVKRFLASPQALQNPATRCSRYQRMVAARLILAWLCIAVGLAYGFLVEPDIHGVGPFWIAAYALGALAWPRHHDLLGFHDRIPRENTSS
jgi:hypothetical protein